MLSEDTHFTFLSFINLIHLYIYIELEFPKINTLQEIWTGQPALLGKKSLGVETNFFSFLALVGGGNIGTRRRCNRNHPCMALALDKD